MADKDVKGQLLFDLIAPVSGRPSAFEEAAWAAASASLAGRSQLDHAAHEGPAEAPDEIAHGTAGSTSRRQSDHPRLHLVPEGDEEPPLIAGGPVGESDAAGPGPRVAAFAAATGAATRSRTPTAAPPVSAATQGVPFASEPPAPREPPTPVEAEPSTRPPVMTDPGPPEGSASKVQAAEIAGAATSPEPTAAAPEIESSVTAPRAVLPPVDNDDDFGPLIRVERPSRRRRRVGRRKDDDAAPAGEPAGIRRGRRRAGWLLAVVIAVTASAATWWLVAGRAQPLAEAPPATSAQAPDTTMVAWHGMDLPVSVTAGPSTFTDTAVGGFTRSALGAAIAAAHLGVRTDPVAGADVFEPVLATQVVGAKDRLADAVRAQAAADPPPGTPSTLRGWRLDGDPTEGAVVAHLAVDQSDGTRVDFAVPLAWVDGDWRIDAPADGDFFPITELSGDYTAFIGEGTIS